MKKTPFERHPDLEQIKRFVHGEASPAENRELVRHLLHGCSECQQVVRKAWSEEASLGTCPAFSNTLESPVPIKELRRTIRLKGPAIRSEL